MFYSKKELMELGFEYVGDNTRVSKLANFYVCEGSRIGDDTRIDDYCTFKGKFFLEESIHIGSFCIFSAVGGLINLKKYCAVSSHCCFWTATEDFLSPTLMSPAIDKQRSKSINGPIELGISAKVGCHCVFLPNASLGFGSAVVAGSVVQGTVAAGNLVGPKFRGLKKYGERDITIIRKQLEEYEKNKNEQTEAD